MTPYKLVRSKRKTVAVQVTRDGAVVVRAPLKMPQHAIEAFVSKHEDWIQKHLREARHVAETRLGFDFSDGQIVYYLGDAYQICTDAACGAPFIEDGALCLPVADRARTTEAFLRREAKAVILERVAQFAPLIGVVPQAVTITGAKTRWGSCSGKNRLSFAFRLICLPMELVDYVVVHELAHILEHNHSQRFYARVAAILPDYRRRQAALGAFRGRLTF